MKKCKYCQSEIDSNAKICPNCRKKQKKLPLWAIILIVIFGIALISSLADSDSNSSSNSSDSSSNENETTTTTKTTEKKELTLEDDYTAYLDSAGFAYYIEGYINNPTNKDYNYVQITFTTYDAEGNTLGTCIDNNSGLEKNGRWKFKAMCLENSKDIASVKLKEITGW